MSNKKFDLEKDFELFRQNVISLCVEWDFYKSLFSNDESINILNKSASYFFSRLQIMLIDTITLKIGNLLDKKETFGKSNLSFDYLFENIPTQNIYYSEPKYYACSYLDGKFLATKYSCIYPIQPNTHCGFLVKVQYWSYCNTLEQQLEDLKDKFKNILDNPINLVSTDKERHLVKTVDTRSEVVDALIELGYSRAEALDAVIKIPKELTTIEECIKYALKSF